MKGYQIPVAVLFLTLFFCGLRPAPAFAGGEDMETFQADCSGFDPSTSTYRRGGTCTVDLLSGSCIHNSSSTRVRGFVAQVQKLQGRRWVGVTRATAYSVCEAESENGVNRKMSFRAKTSGTYRVILDGVGDRRPAFVSTVLAVNTSSDLKTFYIKVR